VEPVTVVVADRDAIGQVGAELVERQLPVEPEVHPVAGGDGGERPALGLGDATEDERLTDAGSGIEGGRGGREDLGHRNSWALRGRTGHGGGGLGGRSGGGRQAGMRSPGPADRGPGTEGPVAGRSSSTSAGATPPAARSSRTAAAARSAWLGS